MWGKRRGDWIGQTKAETLRESADKGIIKKGYRFMMWKVEMRLS